MGTLPAGTSLPNAPLGEVTFELKFPGELGLYKVWGDVQSDLAKDFPLLLVPKLDDGDFAALKPFHLSSEDKAQRVCLAVNMFAFITQKYVSFESFREEAARLLATFSRRFQVKHLTRVGLRYVNWLPARISDAPLPPTRIHPCLKIELLHLPGQQSAVPGILCQSLVQNFRLTTQLYPEERGTRLDFDCYQQGEMQTEKAMELLDAAHEVIDAAFFELITPEYLGYLKGQVQT